MTPQVRKLMTDPKFSGLRTKCPKCTSIDGHVANYVRGLPTPEGAEDTEFMRRGCKTCGYGWREQVADAGGDTSDKKAATPLDDIIKEFATKTDFADLVAALVKSRPRH
jgi:rubredoxin